MSATNGNKLAILTYHSLDSSGSVVSVAPSEFADQMACISEKGMRGVSLSEAVKWRNRNGVWPQGVVALTFDDGFANFYDEGLPVLARYGFTATVFVVSGHMGGHNDWGPQPDGLGTHPILSWQQVRELASAGIEIGSHTRTHPSLRRCSNSETKHEITSSADEIEDHVGLRVQSFAFPYGETNQISRKLAARRFQAACTTELRRAGRDELNLLPRVDMYYLRQPERFAHLLDGQIDQYLAFRRWGRQVRRIFNSDSEKGQRSKAVRPSVIASARVLEREKGNL